VKCANCEREVHDPVYTVCITRGTIQLGVNICGHCWVTAFMEPLVARRLESLAFKSSTRLLPGM
jgi:hypothetical protein